MLLRRSAFVTVTLAVALLLGPAASKRSVADAAPVTPVFGPAIDPFASYVPQTTCSPTAKPGTIALRDLLEATYPATSSMGIGRECGVGGTSEHKEGRAYDWGVNAGDPAQLAMALDFLTWLLSADSFGNKFAMARRLGVMYVIFNRMTWKAYAPEKGWQPYSGSSPHTDHVHISLSWAGANALTSWYPPKVVAPPAPGKGYWLPTDLGVTVPFAAPSFGSLTVRPSFPVVGMAPTPTGLGYWHVATDGGIFAFGDAAFLGSTGGIALNRPIVGMASTPSGRGYWLVASDGGIFAYGDAPFLGSTGGIALNRPIVGMAATPSGRGYWLVASDGGIFAYGDAAFRGSTGAFVLNRPIVAMAPSGDGYWMVASDGGIFAFGDAQFHGSTGGADLASPIRSMASTATGGGYWMAAANGGVYAFGDAPYQGSAAALGVNVVGIARYL